MSNKLIIKRDNHINNTYENINKSTTTAKANKKKDTVHDNKIKIGYNIIIIFKLFIEINLFIQVLSINVRHLIEEKFSKISLKIRGTGIKKIFNNLPEKDYPNEVYINNSKQNISNNTYQFSQEDNSVELIWYMNLYN